MNAIMRKGVRGAAAGLGALAIIVGASACGALGDLAGGGDGGDDPAVEEPAEDEGAEDAGDEAGDSGDDAEGDDAASGDGEALSEEDLTAAGDQYFAFMQAGVSGEAETACSLMTDPTTGEPMSGAVLEGCTSGFEEKAGSEGIELDPAMADMLDRSMIEATDNGDGTAGITMMDSDAGVTMVKAGDGEWYIDGGAL
jgi:hypothetical protein